MQYSLVLPTFWKRGSGKRLRGNKSAQILALYLMTNDDRNLIGLYYLERDTACLETGLSPDEFDAAMTDIADMASYDPDSGLVWVHALARYQIGATLSVDDKRRKAVLKELGLIGEHPFVSRFIARYGDAYKLGDTQAPIKPHEPQAPPKDHTSPTEGVLEGAPIDTDTVSDTVGVQSRARARDHFGSHFAGQSPAQREDVQRLHAAYCVACDYPNAKLGTGMYDATAQILADAIDTHGLAACLTVLKHAPNDGMVSGKLDEHGQKHDTIKYIFGNPDAFNRIARAAEDAKPERRKPSPAEAIAAAKRGRA